MLFFLQQPYRIIKAEDESGSDAGDLLRGRVMGDFYRELDEAIVAGERALGSLHDAKKYLNSASNWGLLDIFGGDTFSGLFKHMKISKANNCLYQAKSDLNRFRKELDDIDDYIPDFEVGGFLVFADFFFDGLIADIFVQSKIGEMKRQVEDAIGKTEEMVRRLKAMK